MNLEPLFGRVIVRTEPINTRLKTNLIIPETAEHRYLPDQGEVVAVGPTAEGVSVGDKVLWGKWAAKKIPWDDGLWVMQDEDVIGIIRDGGKA